MTAKELIKELEKYEDDLEVYIRTAFGQYSVSRVVAEETDSKMYLLVEFDNGRHPRSQNL